MTFKFEYISPNDIHKHWNVVREGLLKVRDHSEGSWIPEDVYSQIKLGNSTLHLGMLNENYKGFIVLTPVQKYDGVNLHIWATYSEANDFCVFTEGIEQIKQFAKNINANKITFTSPRKGWEKNGEKLGFKPVTVKYELGVQQ